MQEQWRKTVFERTERGGGRKRERERPTGRQTETEREGDREGGGNRGFECVKASESFPKLRKQLKTHPFSNQ